MKDMDEYRHTGILDVAIINKRISNTICRFDDSKDSRINQSNFLFQNRST